jgi:hypothetical protein
MTIRATKICQGHDQPGFIMLALLLIMVIGGSSLVLAGLSNRQAVYLRQQHELHQQLESAKANLLAYVANSNAFYDDTQGPGFFPCPDTDQDGVAEISCTPINAIMPDCASNTNRPAPKIGRLPEYVVQGRNRILLSNFYAGTDQQFWYVVAPRYVYSDVSGDRQASDRTSTASSGTIPAPACMRLYLDDSPEYVAFIIAPGEALTSQDRVANSTLYSNYLDGGNGATNYYYSTSDSSNPAAFNDQIIGITLDEYVKAVGIRVAIETKKQIDAYYVDPLNGAYPPTESAFQLVLDDTADHRWLWPSTVKDLLDYEAYNDEQWSTAITYALSNDSQAIINFNGCTGITFTLQYPAGITRSGNSC